MNHDPSGDQRLAEAYLGQAKRQAAESLANIKHCLDQLTDEQVWWRPHESGNSIANIVLHLCGNLQQWIASGVGGAPDARDRPREFSQRELIPKKELLRRLEEAIDEATAVLDGVAARQLLDGRRIQGFDETVLSAIFVCVSHMRGHAQEVVYVTRFQLGDGYVFRWTPTTPEEGAAP
jgi:hypothetical protein